MAGTDLRIVLLGKTGVGKSASGNTILGTDEFVEDASPESVTRHCKKFETKLSGRKVSVVDSPGLFDTSLTNAELKDEIVKCVYMTVPGPHVFLLVLRLGVRYTEEEKNTMKWIQQNFSKLALKYAMILFTCMDSINIELDDYIAKSPALTQLISECGGRYHAFDNRKKDRTQVTRLLAKIDKMVAANGGEHYTDQMYQEAQRKIREEEEKKRREEEMKRQEKERKRQEEQRKREEALRKEFERQEKQRKEDDKREYEKRRVEERRMFEELERKKEEAMKQELERRDKQAQALMSKMEEDNKRRLKAEEERREQEKREYNRRLEEERKRMEEDDKRREQEMKELKKTLEEERERREEDERRKRREEEEERKNNPFNIAGKILMTVPALVGGATVGAARAIVDVPIGMIKGGMEQRNGDIVDVIGGELKGGVKEVANAPGKIIDGGFGLVRDLWK